MQDDASLESDWRDLAAGRLEPGRRVRMPVLSGSMMPLLPVGAEVEIETSAGRRPSLGDIVCYREGETLTVHRVLLRLPGGTWLYQKGDTNPRGAWIRAEAVVGLVVGVARADGVRRDLRAPDARAEARRQVIRQLRRDLKMRVRGLLGSPRTPSAP